MSAPKRIQQRRTKGSHDPRPTSKTRPCYRCGERAEHGQNGYCGPVCRFWSNVTQTGGCWLWGGAPNNSKGYGRVDAFGTRWVAHRFSYAIAHGPIPEGYEVDHLCKNTRCVNPSHLEAVTPEEHARRTDQGAYQRAKTHCPRGHEYAPENTRMSGRRRHCRACSTERSRARASANSAA